MKVRLANCPLEIRRYLLAFVAVLAVADDALAEPPGTRTYENRLTLIDDPQPLLADYPEFVQPIVEERRYEAPMLIDEAAADLAVRAWRFSYNARGIIEMPNRLEAGYTAIIFVHPWGIDDSHGWKTPEPAGVAERARAAHLIHEHEMGELFKVVALGAGEPWEPMGFAQGDRSHTL